MNEFFFFKGKVMKERAFKNVTLFSKIDLKNYHWGIKWLKIKLRTKCGILNTLLVGMQIIVSHFWEQLGNI